MHFIDQLEVAWLHLDIVIQLKAPKRRQNCVLLLLALILFSCQEDDSESKHTQNE